MLTMVTSAILSFSFVRPSPHLATASIRARRTSMEDAINDAFHPRAGTILSLALEFSPRVQLLRAAHDHSRLRGPTLRQSLKREALAMRFGAQ